MTVQVAQIQIRETRSRETDKGIEKEIKIFETRKSKSGKDVKRVITYEVTAKKGLPAKQALIQAKKMAIKSYYEKKKEEGWIMTKVRRPKLGTLMVAFCKKE